MHIVAYILRGVNTIIKKIVIFFRICWLRLLYPGLYIDFHSTIEANCNIKCVKGGTLIIRRSAILSGTQIIADANACVIIENAFIGRNCVIAAKNSIHIHKGCLLAEMVVVRDQDHELDITAHTGQRDGFTHAPVIIGENAWIASKATILKGVKVGASAVVAASAVINKDVPEKEVWGGIPGKFLKDLKTTAGQPLSS